VHLYYWTTWNVVRSDAGESEPAHRSNVPASWTQAFRLVAPVTELVISQCERNLLLLAGSQRRALKTFELTHGPRGSAGAVMDVDLNHLVAERLRSG
jgi:hypothetical protein